MKIQNQNDLGAVSSPGAKGTAGVEGSGRREAGRGVDKAGADRAELSGLAGKISEAVAKDAADRVAKVEQLRVQVAEGTYRADPAAISQGIVQDALANTATAGGPSKE
jgi:flagellar biosynthesis anti-sigma factor FlgM